MNVFKCLPIGIVICPIALVAESPTKRPNVVLIYADDLGYGDLSCYGASRIQTPHIDALSREGLRFTNAYAAAATSTPSRYAMLTGEYAWRRKGTDVATGDAGMIIRPERFTLADLFQSEGYATAAIGKWHLGLGDKTGEQDWNAPLSCSPRDLGFEYSYIMAATGDRVPCVFIEQGRVAQYDASAPIEVSYQKPFAGEPLGRTNPTALTKLKHSHGHDMAIVNGIGRIGYMRGGGKALWRDEEIADSIVGHATQFIEKHRSEPFFLYFAPNDIHVPRYPHKRFRGKSSMGLRGDAILQLDWTVGELIRTLRKHQLLENTIIIFSSDNGAVVDDGYDDKAEALLSGHSVSGVLRGHKYSALEGGARVPTIVRCPWGGKGISTAVVSQIDWLASFAHLLGAKLPKGGDVAPDSHVDTSAWLEGSVSDRPYIITQAANKTLAIRQGKWKYIEPSDGPKMIPWGPKIETGYLNAAQLYDLEQDPSERHNLAEQKPELVAHLARLLELERREKHQKL